jgi:polar amino acid transport system permease protein
MLGSSLMSAISVPELTGITNSLQSTTFRSFEFYFVSTGIYLLMSFGFRGVLAVIYKMKFKWAVAR